MTEDNSPAAMPARQLYRIPEAVRLLSLSRSAVYEEIRAGRLRTVKRGRTRLVPAQAITEYVQLLIQESSEEEVYAETA